MEPHMTVITNETATPDRGSGSTALEALMSSLDRYFELMYDCDITRFHEVFAPTTNLHGEREGRMVHWTATEYKAVLENRQSPKSLEAVRADKILLVDFASESMAITKVRVNLAHRRFVDYLTWHRIDGKWLITSKGYYVEDDGRATG
jgi:Putative lumazine-binding